MLWGRIQERSGAPPFWPWVQVIRSYVESEEPDRLRKSLAKGAGIIARIVPEIRQSLGEIDTPPALDDPESAESERFRLFDSIYRFLKAASKIQPLVIIIDDLHWSDEPSLKLLEFLAHELEESRLLVVGTYRDTELRRTHPLSRALGDIARVRQFERIILRGLSKPDVARLVECSADRPVPTELAETIYIHTEGNPMFAGEVIRHLGDEGLLTAEALSRHTKLELRIPEGVREVIGRRLDRLPKECNRLLQFAAVVGREFGLDLLFRLIDHSDEDDLREAAAEALAVRIIEELPNVIDHYRFSHQLIQDTLSEELTVTERIRLHARIAEILEKIYGDAAEEHAAALATHFAEARILLGTEKLVRYSIAAGKQAVDRCAYEEGLAIYRRATDAVKDQPMDDKIAELYFGYALPQFVNLEFDAAVETLARLFGYYEQTGRISEISNVARWLWYFGTCQSSRATVQVIDYCRRALELCDASAVDDPKVLINLALLRRYVTEDFRTARSDCHRAVAIAEERRDTAQKRNALRALASFEGWTGHGYSALKHYRNALKIPEKDENLASKYVDSIDMLIFNTLIGDPEEALLCANLAEQATNVLGIPRFSAAVCSCKQKVASMTGEWQRARDCFEEGMSILKR